MLSNLVTPLNQAKVLPNFNVSKFDRLELAARSLKTGV
jgi:hypothetical protein